MKKSMMAKPNMILMILILGLLLGACQTKETINTAEVKTATAETIAQINKIGELSDTDTAIPKTEATLTYKTIGITMGEPNYTIDDAYQDLEHGFLTTAEYDVNDQKQVFAPLQDMIVKGLRGSFHYQEQVDEIEIKVDNHTIQLQIGSNQAVVNGTKTELSTAPYIKDERIFLPFNFVMESLGGEVRWEAKRPRILAVVPVYLSEETRGYTTGGDVTLKKLFEQEEAWYDSAEALTVAQTFLSYQNKDGGWPKVDANVNLLEPVSVLDTSTIDNNATFDQMRYLAKMYVKTDNEQYQEAFSRGLQYILGGQNENGGWPQFFPNAEGYLAYLTFNDDAIVNILEMLTPISTQTGDYGFVDDETAEQAKRAVEKGIEFILATQIVVDGTKTAWAAQYDPGTLEPARARSYELPALSGQESVGIVHYLMSIENPSPEIIIAINQAMKWFDDTKITGYKVVDVEDFSISTGKNRILVEDSESMIWGRFIEIGTNRPIFSGRDGEKKYNYEEVPIERRANYSWYSSKAKVLLEEDYPKWQAKHSADNN